MERKITFVIANQTEKLSTRLADAAKTDSRIAPAGFAKNAEQGAALVKEQLPDILIIDLELDNSSGITLLEGIQDIPRKPVIFMTTPRVDSQLCQQITDLGVDYLIVRPIEEDALVERFFSCVDVLNKQQN